MKVIIDREQLQKLEGEHAEMKKIIDASLTVIDVRYNSETDRFAVPTIEIEGTIDHIKELIDFKITKPFMTATANIQSSKNEMLRIRHENHKDIEALEDERSQLDNLGGALADLIGCIPSGIRWIKSEDISKLQSRLRTIGENYKRKKPSWKR